MTLESNGACVATGCRTVDVLMLSLCTCSPSSSTPVCYMLPHRFQIIDQPLFTLNNNSTSVARLNFDLALTLK
ncbi:hypothetical protein BLOT_006228 [Blomia tropicalis]|nr:hypothetical protein BLOT_006228 [Blomia tropicalis]